MDDEMGVSDQSAMHLPAILAELTPIGRIDQHRATDPFSQNCRCEADVDSAHCRWYSLTSTKSRGLSMLGIHWLALPAWK